jgi:hypothetical protein
MADEDDRTQEQAQEVEEEFLDDPFEGFDVIEEEKAFLLSLLETAPVEEVEALKQITDSPSTTAGARFSLIPITRSAVEEYARTHSFRVRGKLQGSDDVEDREGTEMDEFKKDVYKFARATGMGRNQARFEVTRALAAWRRERRLRGGELLSASDEESCPEVEICARPILTGTPLAPVVDSEANKSRNSKKRKRSPLREDPVQVFSSQVVEPDIVEIKRRRKALKKERRRAARSIKIAAQQTLMDVEKEIGVQGLSLPPTPEYTSIAGKAADEKLTEKRKKSNLGPLTSSYFTESLASAPRSNTAVIAETRSEIVHVHTRKKAKKRQQDISRTGARTNQAASVPASLRTCSVLEEVEAAADESVFSLPSSNPPANVQEIEEAEAILNQNQNLDERGSEIPSKKRRRNMNRQRNHNRLPEESRSPLNIQDSQNSSTMREQVGSGAEKCSLTEAFVRDLSKAANDQAPNDVSRAREHGDNNIKNELKRKKKASRETLPQAEQVESMAVEQSHVSIPNPEDTKTLTDNRNAETTKQLVNSEKARGRRDRGRKPKGKYKESAVLSNDDDTKHSQEHLASGPLAGLTNTNTKLTKQDKEARGRTRWKKSNADSEMEVNLQSSREQSKDCHS